MIRSIFKYWKICIAIAVFAVFMLVAFFMHGQTASNTYYVAQNGSDNNSGTETRPWLTIQKAATKMVAGDTVIIKAGTYNEQVVPSNSGAAGKYITYKNYGTDVVNIYGGSSRSTNDNIHAVRKSYLQFIGLHLVGKTFMGIDLSGCSYVTVKDCYITGSYSSGIQTNSANNYITIDGCEITATNTGSSDEMISLAYATNFEIKHCKVHNPIGAIRNGIDMKHGCSKGSCHDNEVYSCTDGGIYIDARGDTSNISIYNNKVYNNAYFGIEIGDEDGESTLTNINIYNNLIYYNDTGFKVSLFRKETFNFYFINNTLYSNGKEHEIFILPSSSQLSNCIIRNNIIYGKTSKAYAIQYTDYKSGGITIDHNMFFSPDGYFVDSVLGTDYIVQDPQFIKAPEDFSLQSSSLAIDAGYSEGAPNTDYEGTVRPQGAGYDIGAFEYILPLPEIKATKYE